MLNTHTDVFWKRYCTYDSPPVIDVESIKPVFEGVGTNLLQLLRQKVQNPLEPLVFTEECKTAIEMYRGLLPVIQEYNQKVELINEQIRQRNESAGKADIAALENNVAKFSLLKKRFDEPFMSLCNELSEFQRKKMK